MFGNINGSAGGNGNDGTSYSGGSPPPSMPHTPHHGTSPHLNNTMNVGSPVMQPMMPMFFGWGGQVGYMPQQNTPPPPARAQQNVEFHVQCMNEEVAERYRTHSSFSNGETALDLFCVKEQLIKAGTTAHIPLGVKICAWDDSNVNVNWMLVPSPSICETPIRVANSATMIPAANREEIRLVVDNIKNTDFHVHPGDRLCRASSLNGRPLTFKIVDQHVEAVPVFYGGVNNSGPNQQVYSSPGTTPMFANAMPFVPVENMYNNMSPAPMPQSSLMPNNGFRGNSQSSHQPSQSSNRGNSPSNSMNVSSSTGTDRKTPRGARKKKKTKGVVTSAMGYGGRSPDIDNNSSKVSNHSEDTIPKGKAINSNNNNSKKQKGPPEATNSASSNKKQKPPPDPNSLANPLNRNKIKPEEVTQACMALEMDAEKFATACIAYCQNKKDNQCYFHVASMVEGNCGPCSDGQRADYLLEALTFLAATKAPNALPKIIAALLTKRVDFTPGGRLKTKNCTDGTFGNLNKFASDGQNEFEDEQEAPHPDLKNKIRYVAESPWFGKALVNWTEREDWKIVSKLVELGGVPKKQGIASTIGKLVLQKIDQDVLDNNIISLINEQPIGDSLENKRDVFRSVMHKIVDQEKKEFAMKLLDDNKWLRQEFCDYGIATNHHRFVCQFVFKYGMQKKYPNLPADVCLFVAHGILKRGLVGVATSVAHGFPAVQWKCLREMFKEGTPAFNPDFALDLALNAWGFKITEVASRLHISVTKMEILSRKMEEERAKNFLQLPSDVKIFIIDAKEGLEHMTNVLLAEDAIGLDCEGFRNPQDDFLDPTRKTNPVPCQWMQLATDNCVFLIDLATMKEEADSAIQSIWKSDVSKIGLAMNPDIAAASKTIGVDPQQCANRIELQSLLPKPGKGKKISLSSVVEEHFGQPLEKYLSTSDWQLRPLLVRQMKYAALDAWVTLQCYRKLIEKRKNDGLLS